VQNEECHYYGFWQGGWGSSHKVHGRTLKKMKTLLKQFEQANLPM